MAADEQYSVRSKENFQQPVQRQLFKEQKSFSQVFPQYLISTSNFECSEKKMTDIRYVFSKLQTKKELVS